MVYGWTILTHYTHCWLLFCKSHLSYLSQSSLPSGKWDLRLQFRLAWLGPVRVHSDACIYVVARAWRKRSFWFWIRQIKLSLICTRFAEPQLMMPTLSLYLKQQSIVRPHHTSKMTWQYRKRLFLLHTHCNKRIRWNFNSSCNMTTSLSEGNTVLCHGVKRFTTCFNEQLSTNANMMPHQMYPVCVFV